MRIGELAARSGVSVRALRYYEERGLLAPRRTATGYRVFEHDDVDTVGRIQTLLRAGLGTELIAQILSCMSGEELLLGDCRERLGVERGRMTADITRLVEARTLLDELLEAPV